LSFGIEFIIFWGFIFYKNKFKFVKGFLILNFSFLILFFIFSSPFTVHRSLITVPSGPALETGGTESGSIRKYVWLGAIEIVKHYPILGTGPETFAFSFPMYKPIEHNLTSEWDFIYNKAHNEFLNYLANTGLLGFLSYLLLIIFSVIIFWKSKRFDLLSGYIAILITNFFGFSIVPVSLLFFLFPAFALVESIDYKIHIDKTRLKFYEKVAIFFVLCTMYYVLFCIAKYWKADVYYNYSKFDQALNISPNEAIYISKQALSDTNVETASKALKLSPFNQIKFSLLDNLNFDTISSLVIYNFSP